MQQFCQQSVKVSGPLVNINQSGFQKRRNTLNQLFRLSDDILKGVAKRSYVFGEQFDIEKAFDMVWRKGVLYKMDQLGFGGRMFNQVHSFLSGHTIQVGIGSVMSYPVEVENDTSHGSVISPIQFLLAIYDLSPKGVNASMFADDTVIWETEKDVVQLNAKSEYGMDSVVMWKVGV